MADAASGARTRPHSQPAPRRRATFEPATAEFESLARERTSPGTADHERGLTYGASVRVTGLTPNLPVADIDAARGFYTDYLGLNEEQMNLGWVARYRSPDGRVSVQLVTRDATSPQDSVISVHVGSDVDEAYAEAQSRGYEIVHPLTDEPWGVRRFLVRAPDGNVINVVSHRDE